MLDEAHERDKTGGVRGNHSGVSGAELSSSLIADR